MTVLPLLILLGSLAVLAVVALVLAVGVRRTNCHLSQEQQITWQSRALQCWAGDNNGRFPLPSLLDATDATDAAQGAAKNTSGNIFSVLIFNWYTIPEVLVDKYESGNIDVDPDYEHSAPRAAVRPEEALWDPAFNADFTGALPGNLSWAHQIPAVERAGAWSNALSSATPVVSSRGAKMTGIGGTAEEPIPIWADPESRNLRRSGGRLEWEGAVAYGDGHVTHETSVFAWRPVANPASILDAIFFDEPGAEHVGNDYLSIFTTAGEQRGDFAAIWD